jgi:opacity protein-like surface antigen
MKNSKYYIFAMVTFIAISVNAQIGVSVKGGSYVPVGEFTNNYDVGFGGEFIFSYRSNPRFEIGITTGYSHYTADQDALKEAILKDFKDELDQINIDGTIDVEAPLNIYPLALNIKYIFGNKKVKPYFFFEGGIFFYDLTTRGHIEIKNGPTIDIPETVERENSTMLGIGGGIQFRLTKKLFFDVSAKWSIMNNIKLVEADVQEELSGVKKTAQTVALLGGLSYYF